MIDISYTACLLVHYAPHLLVVLRRKPCAGIGVGWGGEVKHGGACICHGQKTMWVTVGRPCLLTPDEQDWVLSRCWIPQRVDVEVAV